MTTEIRKSLFAFSFLIFILIAVKVFIILFDMAHPLGCVAAGMRTDRTIHKR